VAVLLWTVVRAGGHRAEKQLTFTAFMSDVDAGKVKSVTINGTEVHGLYQGDAEGLRTTIPANYPEVYKRLDQYIKLHLDYRHYKSLRSKTPQNNR
jgi:cell division protease FtsH